MEPSSIASKTPAGGKVTESALRELYAEMKEAVLSKRPVLRQIIEKHGEKKLAEYVKDYTDVNMVPAIVWRQDEFLGTLGAYVAKRQGNEIADAVTRQLKKYYVVSTADHHGPTCHPFFLNANILFGLPISAHQDADLRYNVVLACANVSLNNSSFPRGLLFTSPSTGEVKRLSFLPSNAHASAVYNFRAYTKEELDKMKKLLRQYVREGHVRKDHGEVLHQLIDDVYAKPDILAAETYSDQVCKTNTALWHRMFEKSAARASEMIYVEQESLVIELITKHHLTQDTTITHMLFDPEYDELFARFFEGIQGTFHRGEGWGTYLFWGVSPDKNFRVQLWKQGNALASRDGKFRVALTPEGLREAMEQKRIVPSMMLIFIVLSFYYGLKCLGGFNQTNYLTFMKNAYIHLQVERGNYRSIEVCARAQTKEINDGILLAFSRLPSGALTPTYGLDLLFWGNAETWGHLQHEAQQMSLAQALAPMYPEFYRVVYSDPQRKQELLQITSQDLTKLSGLEKYIQPCISMS